MIMGMKFRIPKRDGKYGDQINNCPVKAIECSAVYDVTP
jgi:hypothetical protein